LRQRVQLRTKLPLKGPRLSQNGIVKLSKHPIRWVDSGRTTQNAFGLTRYQKIRGQNKYKGVHPPRGTNDPSSGGGLWGLKLGLVKTYKKMGNQGRG